METQLPKLNIKIAITGGGSGGHISPVEAIIAELRSRYSNAVDQIIYIGGKLGMEGEIGAKSAEQKIFENSNINFVAIRAGKLQRYLSINSIKSFMGVFGGLIDAYKVLKANKPDLLFSTGGYVSVPVCIAAWILKIPIFIHEQTAAVGLTIKITAPLAKKILITFEKSKSHFPASKCVLTGNPVRPVIFENSPDENWKPVISAMIAKRSKEGKPIIFVMGGGLGSHLFNEFFAENLVNILRKYQVILQMGDNQLFKDYDNAVAHREKLPFDLKASFYPTKYVNSQNIGAVFSAADMFFSRAGAAAVNEVGALKLPTLFIPIPWVTNNEQEKNARVVQELGLAEILHEKDFNHENVITKIESVLKIDPSKVDTSSQFITDGAKRIVDLLVQEK